MTTEQTPSAEEGQEMWLRASETVSKVTDLQVAVMRQKNRISAATKAEEKKTAGKMYVKNAGRRKEVHSTHLSDLKDTHSASW